MTYVIAAAGGLLLGALMGLLKYVLLWKPIILGKRGVTSKNIAITQIISMLINVGTLLAVYFLRNVWPYSFEVTIVSVAVALALTTKLSPFHGKKQMEKLMQMPDGQTQPAQQTEEKTAE